ncbi:minor tail protein [Gordonia phage Tarzan]|uniref:Minor tail protein n=1 Tax=Gordonia phage Tarzan TaxID=3038367 RepID=A0AAF0GFC7_9CAUD|nr:minor tail protein [Gordonia phage Tarzan]WGH20060.1 minor tail protein [Gordonia phage Tarzan]
MTSPDGAGLPSGPEKIGQWNPLVALGKLGEQLIMTPLSHLLAWILDDEPEEWDTFEELAANIIPALIRLPLRVLAQLIGGIPIVGDAVEDALAGWLKDTNENATDAIETVVNVGTQINYVQQIIALQSGMGVHETGPDRTGTPSFNFSLLHLPTHPITHDLYFDRDPSTFGMQRGDVEGTITQSTNPPVVSATASYAPWANVIFKTPGERKVLTWLAYKSGTVSTFHLDVYRLEQDGSSTFLYSSPNLAGEVPVSVASIGWMQHLMSGASITADYGDIYDVQFRMTGSGAVHIAGVNFMYPTPLPGFRPYASGSGRNPTTTPAPATISTTARDAMYVGPCPFVSIGIDVGQTQIPRFFFDDFNRADLGARWIRYGSSIGITDNKVQFTGSSIANASAAAMYHQPLATDLIEVGFDATIDEEDVGVGVHCPSGLGNGVWVTTDVGGVRVQTGAYNSRTDRVTAPVPGSGRYTVRVIRDLDDTHFIYQVFFGDPNAEDAVPVVTWPDTANTIPAGIGRRWWGVMARRNGLIYPSGRLDNVTAADITTEET